jgi:asparagine synthase (glutamine-hydrolysing)
MSGIAGLWRLDGSPVERRDLDRVANAMRMHGPDRADVVTQGSVGLVHVLMRMTPEDRFDRQPIRGASGAMITADLRLDNRDDLLSRIGVSAQEAIGWADSRIALAAWEKLGNDIWPMLRGPFTVAIFDPRSRTLTLARDHLGLAVAMWHANSRFFAFATMPKGLFALPDVPRELSREKMADFLVLNHADHGTTIYQGIFRVLPAHVMTVKADGSIAQRRYWSERDIKSVRLGSDQAYADGLRDCLDRAVRRQLRSAHPVGCYLTGGLDSSSVAALAARALAERNERLATFTQVPREGFSAPAPRGRYNDETPYVEAIRAALGNVDVNYVRNSDCDDFAELERFFLVYENPVRNPTNLGWALAIARLARAQGRRVLLGGMLGNYTISWFGWSQLAANLMRGRLLTAFRQCAVYWHTGGESLGTAIRKMLIEPMVPDALGSWAHKRRHRYDVPWTEHSAINPAFATEMDVAGRARGNGHDFLHRMRPSERVFGLIQHVDYLGDWYAAEKAITGVEQRDPTADVDVVEYCFGVPPAQYLAEGIDRSLIRRAMWGLLPEVVLTNRFNGFQAADWYEKLETQKERLAADVAELGRSKLARQTLDLDRLERAIRNWPTGNWHTRKVYYEHGLALTRGIAAGRFLRWVESANR